MNYGELKRCDKCSSSNIKLVKYPISNGTIQYRYQCLDCGGLCNQSIKQNSVPKNIEVPLYDAELRELHYKKGSIQNILANSDMEDKMTDTADSFFETLHEYYKSPEWKAKREQRLHWNQILNNGLCERCNKNKAEHIHHRSYTFLGGMEHPFDLEALCTGCHKELHPHMQGAE